MLRNKKAQLTLFIIIGIVLLIGTFVVIYISNLQKEKTEVPAEIVSTEIPSWTIPINLYVEQCIQTIAIKGFKAIGEHGGYIDLNDEWLSGRSFSINKNPTESDAILFSENSLPVVYWWYLKSPNDCIDCKVTSLTPLLPEIEEQMNKYVNRELEKCLNNFSTFKEQGFTFETGTVKSNTSIQKDDVNILVDYPLTITKGDSRTLIPRFYLGLDLRFREIFELAFLTALNQIENQTQEDILMHLIGIYSGVSSTNKMAPIGWIDHKHSTVTWNLDTIQNNLKQSVLGNIPLIQIDKTRGAKHITLSDPIQRGVYDVMYLKFLSSDYPNLAVNFFYDPSWEIYFDITPKSGKLLSPTTTSQDFLLNILPSKQTNFYQFFYDLSYPIIIIIRDDHSLTKYGEKGYTFMFALEVNVRDNKDLLSWKMGQGTIGKVAYDQLRASFTLANKSAGNCTKVNSKWTCSLDGQQYNTQLLCIQNCIEDTEQTIVDVQKQVTKSLFHNYNQRISKNITVNVFDKQNNPLKDVSILYTCGNYKTTPIGSTNNNGEYTGRFPFCLGDGFLKLEKEGYLTKVEPHISINLDEPKEFNIQLEKLEQKEVEMVYINITNLFRIKRKLYVKQGNNILDDLYYEIQFLQPLLGPRLPPIIAFGHGILKELYRDAHDKDLDSIANQIKQHANKILYARNSIKEIEYYYQLNTPEVVDAAYIARDAAEFAWNLVNEGKLNLGEPYRSKLEQHLGWLNDEIKNIQFLREADLYQQSNINRYRAEALHLKEGNIVTISYQKVKENIYEQNIPMVITQAEYGKNASVNLVPGEYSFNILFRDEKGAVIPAQGIYPQTNYTPAMLGGAEINNQTGLWIITQAELDSNNKVRFYFFKIDDPEQLEDFGEIGAIANYSKRYRAYIEPEFLP